MLMTDCLVARLPPLWISNQMTQTLFHQYELNGMLGSGWLGPVHEAQDINSGEMIALRLVNEQSSSQSFLMTQLKRLLFKVHSLKHPHILPTEPLQQREHRAFYAMTLAERGSVRQLLVDLPVGQKFSVALAVSLVYQATTGLVYAHNHDLMHGNIKPENLLLQAGPSFVDHERYTVMLSDFGLSDLRYGQADALKRISDKDLLYLSPEQKENVRNDQRSDIYSLGLVLHEMLFGELPSIMPLRSGMLTKARSEITPELEHVMITCLEQNPKNRYSSVENLNIALKHVLKQLTSEDFNARALESLEWDDIELDPQKLKKTEEQQQLSGSHLMPPMMAPEPSLFQGQPSTDHSADQDDHIVLEEIEEASQVEDIEPVSVGTVRESLVLVKKTETQEPEQATKKSPKQDDDSVIAATPVLGQTIKEKEVVPSGWAKHDELDQDKKRIEPTTLEQEAPVFLSDTRDHTYASYTAGLEPPEVTVKNWGTVPHLRILDEYHELVRVQMIEGSSFTVGKAVSNTVMLESERIADEHLKVEFRDDEPFVTPLGAAGPVLLDDRPLLVGTASAWSFHKPLYVKPYWLVLLAPEKSSSALSWTEGSTTQSLPKVPWWMIAGGVTSLLLGGLFFWLGRPPEVQQFELVDGGNAVLPKKSFQLQWKVKNATNVQIKELMQQGVDLPLQGKTTVGGIQIDKEYTLITRSWLGRTTVKKLNILAKYGTPVFEKFKVTPSLISGNETVTIQWATRNTEKIELSGHKPNKEIEELLPTGEVTFVPNKNTTVQLKAINGTKTGASLIKLRKQKITIREPQITTFKIEPAILERGQKATLIWKVNHASNVSIQGIGDVANEGRKVVEPSENTTYQLMAENLGGITTEQTAQVALKEPNPEVLAFKVVPKNPKPGQRITASWKTKGVEEVELALGNRKWKAAANGQKTFVAPELSTPLILVVKNKSGIEQSRVVQVKVSKVVKDAVKPKPKPVTQSADIKIQSFVLKSSTPKANKVTLAWKVQNISSIRLDGLSGPNADGSWPAQGRTTVPVSGKRTFVLRAGSAGLSSTVTYQPPVKQIVRPVIRSFSVLPNNPVANTMVTLSWKVSNARRVYIAGVEGPGVDGSWPKQGLTKVRVRESQIFVLNAQNDGQKVTARRAVEVAPAQTVEQQASNQTKSAELTSFYASAEKINPGEKVKLSWRAKNVDQVRIQGINGDFPAQGMTEVRPTQTTTYILLAGTSRRSLTIKVQNNQTSSQNHMVGTWQHSQGILRIQNVQGNRATGIFISNQIEPRELPVNMVFNGQSMTMRSSEEANFSLVASIHSSQDLLRGFYKLNGERYNWCAYRNTKRAIDCR